MTAASEERGKITGPAIVREYFLDCAACDSSANSIELDHTKREAEKDFRAQGWRRCDGLWYCGEPTCPGPKGATQ